MPRPAEPKRGQNGQQNEYFKRKKKILRLKKFEITEPNKMEFNK
jgi:hypothetical protein